MVDKVFIGKMTFAWQDLGAGVKRKIISYDEQLMMVKVAFEQGAIGSLHHHYHTQMTYVISGSFEVQVGDEKQILKKGEVFYAPPNIMHGVICFEAGELLDVFSPMREDFVK
ncbi:MAG: cupin domain-containing protein [Sphingobacteriales bacterium]|nr:cupin domain-containing protein [Sphingobacteriales bacterium]